jgi:hypothetical protein
MGNDNVLMVISIIAVVVAAIGFFMVSGTINVMLAPSATGTADVEIVENARLSMAVGGIDFSPGAGCCYVNDPIQVVLQTDDLTQPRTPMTGWKEVVADADVVFQQLGFVVENIGNVNVDMNLFSQKKVSGDPTDADCIAGNCWLEYGPDDTPATLEYIVRNCGVSTEMVEDDTITSIDCRDDPADVADPTFPDDWVDRSCAAGTEPCVDDDTQAPTRAACITSTVLGGYPIDSDFFLAGGFNNYITIPEAVPVPDDHWVCDDYSYQPYADEIRIDLRLTLPDDIAPTTSGAVTNTIELTVVKDTTQDDD